MIHSEQNINNSLLHILIEILAKKYWKLKTKKVFSAIVMKKSISMIILIN